MLDVADDALLLVTELVTNALLHGAGPLIVSVECVEHGVRVLVRDGSPVLPQQRRAAPEDEGGRGLALLAELSHAWGARPADDQHGPGKVVWFELRPRPGAAT